MFGTGNIQAAKVKTLRYFVHRINSCPSKLGYFLKEGIPLWSLFCYKENIKSIIDLHHGI
jgi:hypothetical protein